MFVGSDSLLVDCIVSNLAIFFATQGISHDFLNCAHCSLVQAIICLPNIPKHIYYKWEIRNSYIWYMCGISVYTAPYQYYTSHEKLLSEYTTHHGSLLRMYHKKLKFVLVVCKSATENYKRSWVIKTPTVVTSTLMKVTWTIPLPVP